MNKRNWGGSRPNSGGGDKRKGKIYSYLQFLISGRVSQESKEIFEKQPNKSKFLDQAIKEFDKKNENLS